jgi:protein-arginine kinase
VIEGYHVGFKADGSMNHVTDMDCSKIKTDLQQSALDKIISTRIRVARNLKAFPLNPAGTKESRLEIIDLMEKVTSKFEGELAGKFYRHTGMSEE